MNICRSLLVVLLAAVPAYAQITPFSINANSGYAGWSVVPSNSDNFRGSFTVVPTAAGEMGSQVATFDGVNPRSWALYANSGNSVSATYLFGGSLQAGNTVAIAMDNGWAESGRRVGFALENSSGTARFRFFLHGGTGYQFEDAAGVKDFLPAQTYTTSGFTITFTQLASTAYNVSFNTTSASNEVSVAVADISQIRLFNESAGPGTPHDVYFNSLVVIPEASSLGLWSGLLALVAGSVLRRRLA